MFFVLLVGVVPNRFYEYLQYRVEVRYEDKEGKEENRENHDGDDFQDGDRDESEECRNDEWEDDEDYGSHESSDIHQEECEIEMECDIEAIQCHPDRETQSFQSFLVFEDNKESSI